MTANRRKIRVLIIAPYRNLTWLLRILVCGFFPLYYIKWWNNSTSSQQVNFFQYWLAWLRLKTCIHAPKKYFDSWEKVAVNRFEQRWKITLITGIRKKRTLNQYHSCLRYINLFAFFNYWRKEARFNWMPHITWFLFVQNKSTELLNVFNTACIDAQYDSGTRHPTSVNKCWSRTKAMKNHFKYLVQTSQSRLSVKGDSW